MPPVQVSVVIPAYNEADNLPELVTEIRDALDPLHLAYEVLFVDDGSSDDSPRLLADLAASTPLVRVLRMPRNRGQSAALAAGFSRARGEIVVTLDADLQNDPADIPRVLAALEGYDMVSGVRQNRQDTWLRKVSSRIANRVRSRVVGDSISDVGCSLKAYRARFLERIPTFNGMHRFLPALVQMEGARVREVPVRHRPRRHGQSKYGVHNRLWRGLVDMAGVCWLKARWVDPREAEEIGPGAGR